MAVHFRVQPHGALDKSIFPLEMEVEEVDPVGFKK